MKSENPEATDGVREAERIAEESESGIRILEGFQKWLISSNSTANILSRPVI